MLFADSTVDNAVENFYVALYRIIDKHVPSITIIDNFKFPKWFNFELKQNILLNRAAHSS